MEPVFFNGVNTIYGAKQSEYRPLPALKSKDGTVITCWRLSQEEIKKIQETGVVFCLMLTFNQPLQPVLLSSEIFDSVESEPCEISDETIRDLVE